MQPIKDVMGPKMKYEIHSSMKKILLFLIIVFLPYILLGQWFGNGLTSSTAYYGKINSANPMADWTIANYSGGVIYVGQPAVNQNDLEIEASGSLTIGPGITIKFCTTESDLRITGSGILSAIGTSSSFITFTKDTQASWGHISFEGSTGASSIKFCIIEYGLKSGTYMEGFGGGIFANTSNLTIENSIIRYNSAVAGGGVAVDRSQNPAIINTLFYSNLASELGGGLFLWDFSSSIIENCIFDSNSALGTSAPFYTGGGLSAMSNCSVNVINCTFVNNTSATTYGNGIQLNNSVDSKIVNSVFWGSSNQTWLLGTNTISYSAFQGQTISGTGNINLSSSNTDINGPNFVDPSTRNWAINFVSPCRDAGTTPSPTIPTDIIGNTRIGPYDIGAYENQYSRWVGGASGAETVWTNPSNWVANILPSTSMNVVIPHRSNNPNITTSDVAITNLITEVGGQLIIQADGLLTVISVTNVGYITLQPKAKATINYLINNGTINLNSDDSGISSLLMNSYTGTGLANIGMYLTGGGGTDNWAWHYVAVPVNYIGDKSVFTNINPLDLIQYDDSQIPNTTSATDNDGWVYQDGTGPSFSDLIVGRGYGFYHANPSVIVNFSNLTSLQTSLGPLSLQYSGVGKLVTSNYGWNLLGNSLSCGIDWNLVVPNGDINAAVYYTINYKIGSYIRSAPDGINGATKDIPPLQGFLVKANAINASLNFSAAREHTGQQRYKKSLELKGSDSNGNGSVDPMIKLELNNSGNQDETLIWLNENATSSFDGKFDALKLLSSGHDQIYTMVGSDKIGIYGIPYPSDTVIIPVAVKFLNTGSNYKIIASKLQGLDNYKVTLTDKGNSDFIVDLKSTNNYTFSSDAGTFPYRFVLTIATISTGISDINIPDKAFNIYSSNGIINIQTLGDTWNGKPGGIKILDMTGRVFTTEDNVVFSKDDMRQIPVRAAEGIYLVEIRSGVMRYVGKVIIR